MTTVLRRLTTFVAAHPAIVIVVVLLITGGLASRIPEGELSNDNSSFAPRSDEVLAQELLAERFDDTTVATLQVIVRGDDVVSADGVATVVGLTRVANEVFGDRLASTDGPGAIVSWLQGVQLASTIEGLTFADLDDAAVDRLQTIVLTGPPAGDNPAPGPPPGLAGLVDQLASGDEPTSAPSGLMLINLDRASFDGNEDIGIAQQEFQAGVLAAGLPLEAIPFSFELVSQPDADFQREVGQLFGLAALVILLVLALVLRARRGPMLGAGGALRRSLADMGISIVTVLLAIIWSQGLGVVLGPNYLGLIGELTPPTQIVPLLLLALGVDYAIHTQSRYREELARGGTVADVAASLGGTVGVALFLSMLTTAIGFLANIFSPIPAVTDLGILSAVGIMSVFLLSITFLPAVRVLLDQRAERRGRLVREEIAPRDDSFLSRVARIGLKPALRAPGVVLSVVLLSAIAGAYGLTQLQTVFSVTAFLPEGSPAKTAFETLSADFGGGLAETTDVLVTGDVLTPAVHNAIADVPIALTDTDGVVELAGTPDVTTPATALRDALASVDNLSRDGMPLPPGQQAAIATAAGLGLQPDGTVSADADVAGIYAAMTEAFPPVAATISLDTPTGDREPALRLSTRTQSDAVGSEAVATTMTAAVAPVADAGADIVVTSEAIINSRIVTSLAASQVSGLILTVVVVLLLLGLVYGLRQRRPGLGMLVVLPVTVVLLWVFGLMAATGIPFDPITALISALVVGVGVDFCIHLGERFIEDIEEQNGDVATALDLSLQHTGAALAGSAATTTLGFMVLTTASIVPFQRLGTVTIYAITLSLAATMFVLPSILVLYARRQFAPSS